MNPVLDFHPLRPAEPPRPREGASRLLLALCAALLVFLQGMPAQAALPTPIGARCLVDFGRDIPIYNWQKRSDWISVKTVPGAKGDGIADDTAAIQRAINRLGPNAGDPQVVYFPPGTYRITQTLTLGNSNGLMLVGHGLSTTIKWDGATDGVMLRFNGAARSIVQGLVFDGRGIAGVGIDHDSVTSYETRVRHESLEFLNFRNAGIRVGSRVPQVQASAEMMYYNLVFRGIANAAHDAAGVKLLAFNDYDNVFDGCLFEDNDYGVFSDKGNAVIRNTRFERSGVSDTFLGTHSHSLRRIVSIDSNRVVLTPAGANAPNIIKMESSRIQGWKATDGAINTGNRGPLLIFDTVFTNPPNSNPPIKLANSTLLRQQAVLSNVTATGSTAAIDPGVVTPASDGLPTNMVASLPPGNTAQIPDINQDFLRSTVSMPTRLLDAKRDCGARGDLKTNDTVALQNCIARAAQVPNGDVYLYIPSGNYKVTRTLVIKDAKFQMGGAGWQSRFKRLTTAAGPIVSIVNPKGLVYEQLAGGGPDGTPTIEQSGNEAGSVLYRGVYAYDVDETKRQSIRFNGLGAGMLVLSDHMDGRLDFVDSGAAHFLFGFTPTVKISVSGKTPPSGFLGFMFRVSALESYPLEVRDNQSVLVADWYNEQTEHLFRAFGGTNSNGSITLDFSKSASDLPLVRSRNAGLPPVQNFPDFASVDSYKGRISVMGGLFGVTEDTFTPVVTFINPALTSLVLMANTFTNLGPAINPALTNQYVMSNAVLGDGTNRFKIAAEASTGTGQAAAIGALDDLREMNDLDLYYNYTKCTP